MVLGLLLVWPLRLVAYGRDSFRTGGDDFGTGPMLFDAASGLFALWSLAWSRPWSYRLSTTLARLGGPLAGRLGPGRAWAAGRAGTRSRELVLRPR